MPSTIYTQALGEHKPISERNTRTLKYRIRSTVHSVPYRKMALLMIYYIVGQEKSMLNDFPSKTGISTTM